MLKVFKAIYYPQGNFLNAQLGGNPSFVWRGILESQSLVRSGARWSVGSGETVKVLGEPWLPDESDPYISSHGQGLQGAYVNQLMKTNVRQWDEELIEDMFNTRDCELIFSIRIDGIRDDDFYYWTKEIAGEYTVKSGYKMLQVMQGRWNSQDNSGFWRSLWNLKIPTRGKDVIWRDAIGCLPTRSQLQAKRVQVQGECPMCNQDLETIFHLFVKCSFVVRCWQQLRVEVQFNLSDFGEWLDEVFKKYGKKETSLIVMLCWALWRARNDKVWKNRTASVKGVVISAKSYLDQWTKAQDNTRVVHLQNSIRGDGAEKWVKPQRNSIKVKVDASIFREQARYGFGVVARDFEGTVVEAKVGCCTGVVEPELAEAIGLKEALSWVKAKRWGEVVFETDCYVVVQAIRSSIKMLSPFGTIIEKCKSLFSSLSDKTLLFVYRSANRVAHSLARATYSYPDLVFRGSNVPTEFLSILLDVVG